MIRLKASLLIKRATCYRIIPLVYKSRRELARFQEPVDDGPGPSSEPDTQQGPSARKSPQPTNSESSNALELESVSISLDKGKEDSNHTELRTVLVSPVSMWRKCAVRVLCHVLFSGPGVTVGALLSN